MVVIAGDAFLADYDGIALVAIDGCGELLAKQSTVINRPVEPVRVRRLIRRGVPRRYGRG